MGSNSDNKTVISRTPPPILGSNRVNLVKNDFDSKVWNDGNDVLIDKAIRCPCRGLSGNQALSSCRNCGGSGYVFINRYSTRLVMQAMNMGTKFKEWSEVNRGSVKITARSEDELAFMDRITLIDGSNIHTETVHTFKIDNSIKGRLDYPPIEIEEISIFVDSNVKLRRLEHITDYTIDSDIISLNNTFLEHENLTVSLRYKHYPTYHVLDLPRGTIQNDTTRGESNRFPINAIGRRAHYVLDAQNIKRDFLLDNSYEVECQERANVVITNNILCT